MKKEIIIEFDIAGVIVDYSNLERKISSPATEKIASSIYRLGPFKKIITHIYKR